jgi:peptidoglycan/xylan/chitin deacetylase (PgdA/CDA1 family)
MRATIRRLRGHGLTALKAVGGFDRYSRTEWRRRRLIILCYHGVSLLDEHEQDPELYIRPELLAQRFDLLRRGGYTVLPLGQALIQLQAGTLPHRAVCLTFDDGMYNFGAAAYPVLQQFGYPATVYLSTYYCIHDEPVFNPLVSYLLRKARGRIIDARAALPVDEIWDLTSHESLVRAFRSIERAVAGLRLTRTEKTGFACRVAHVLDVDIDVALTQRLFHLLRPAEVTGLAHQGVDFQLHTHTHRSPLERDRFVQEIRQNRALMETMVGYTPTHFCYPSGFWRPEFLPWLRDVGVVSATTGDPGLAEAGDDPLMLPRIMDSEARNPIELEGWLTGVLAPFYRS